MKRRPGEARAPRRVTHAVWPLLGMMATVVAVYWSLHDAPFLSWDDDRNIILNPYIRGQSSGIWTAPYFGLYVPVINTIWAVLYRIGGGSPDVYRGYNLALHNPEQRVGVAAPTLARVAPRR